MMEGLDGQEAKVLAPDSSWKPRSNVETGEERPGAIGVGDVHLLGFSQHQRNLTNFVGGRQKSGGEDLETSVSGRQCQHVECHRHHGLVYVPYRR